MIKVKSAAGEVTLLTDNGQVVVNGGVAPLSHVATGKSTDYSQHLGAKNVAGVVQVGDAQTHVPVHKKMLDGGVRVGCSGGRTINLGDYNSLKVNVWLEMPATPETVNEVFDYVSDWVSDQLEKATKFAKG